MLFNCILMSRPHSVTIHTRMRDDDRKGKQGNDAKSIITRVTIHECLCACAPEFINFPHNGLSRSNYIKLLTSGDG